MTKDVGREEEAFPGSSLVDRMLRAYFSCVTEFVESLIVVAVAPPAFGKSPYAVRVYGSVLASEYLARAWTEGQVQEGEWYLVPSGCLGACAEDGVPAPLAWEDAMSRKIVSLSDGLYAELAPVLEGLLVLATSGGGPNGSTKVVVKAYGNGMSTCGALARWLDDREPWQE